VCVTQQAVGSRNQTLQKKKCARPTFAFGAHPVGLSAMTGTPQGLKAIKKQRKNLKLKLLRNQKELSSNRIQFFLVSLVSILKIFFLVFASL
jgi:hypothetical protein